VKALTDPFPIGFSSRWGGFRALVPIPLRFGNVTGACAQYQTGSADLPPRKFWVWSDGACAGVDRVFVDGQERVGGWQASNQVDVTGAVVMMIEFAEPPAQNSIVTAAGRGQIRDGVLVRNPARVIAELARVAGVTVANLDYFEVECARAGIELSGEIASEITIQRAIRSVCESVGAIYSPRMRGTAAIYPGGMPELVNESPRIYAEIAPEMITGWRSELSDVVNALQVNYAMRDGKPTKTMSLEAPASILAYGRRTGPAINAEWIADEGIMANIAARLLTFLARPSVLVTVDEVPADLRPGDWVEVDGESSAAPFASGDRQMLTTSYDAAENLTGGTFVMWADPAPEVIVTGQANILEDEQAVDAESSIIGNSRRVVIKGEGGRPLAGATVLLDGRLPRVADASGAVTFPLADATPGWHDLTVTLNGSASTDPTSVDAGEAGNVTIPGQNLSVPVTFTIRILFA
jgi:hypothetical protein